MSPEMNEQNYFADYSPDLFAEPRDHANLWDVSALWQLRPEESPRPFGSDESQTQSRGTES